jgi:hypothetical protein
MRTASPSMLCGSTISNNGLPNPLMVCLRGRAMKRTVVLLGAVAFSLFASGVLLAQNDPFLGTWRLNVAKSEATGMRLPKSETRTEVAQGDGGTVTTYEGIAASGSAISWNVTSRLDGKDVPISGGQPLGADTLAVKRVDANTRTAALKKAGKTLYTTRMVASKDGEVITITAKGMNGEGQPISYTMVWDKQ